MSLLQTFILVIIYFAIVLAIIPIIFKRFLPIPNEFVRKFQHIGFASSVFIFTESAHAWWEIVGLISVFGVLVFFLMWALERTPQYNNTFVDRHKKGGEMKISLLLAMAMFVMLFTLFGGLLPGAQSSFVVIAVMSWGVGDALAALFGKYLGKRKLNAPYVDQNKTWFGSVSMALGVLVVVFLMMLFYAGEGFVVSFITAVLVAVIATTIEAYSKKGLDTLTIPLGVALTLYGLEWLFIALLGG